MPVLSTYGAETLTLTNASFNKVQVIQRRMEQAMPDLSLRGGVTNIDLRKMMGVSDAVTRMACVKWNWADNQWTKRIIEWRPRQDALRAEDAYQYVDPLTSKG